MKSLKTRAFSRMYNNQIARLTYRRFNWARIAQMVQAGRSGGGDILRTRRNRPAGKTAGHDVNRVTRLSAEAKERVELYFYSPSWPSWPVLW